MRLRTGIAVLSFTLPLLVGCSGRVRLYSTWSSLGEEPGRTRPVAVGAPPPLDARPWAGTVSHHLLAAAQIDRWFAELAARRGVKRFYILSPSHWGLSTQEYSITDGSWRVKGGIVQSDRAAARELARTLGVKLEPSVFDPEHGVATLMPYVSKYFPGARIVAVAYRGEPPLNQPMAMRLCEALAPAFTREGRDGNFLLVSTDFSHHGDRVSTQARDERSNAFFVATSPSTWILVGCDNRPGIYVLAMLLEPTTRSTVLYHCNSWDLSDQDEDNITSYFFSYFW